MLCEVCRRFFTGPLGTLLTKQIEKNVHHQTSRSFSRAVEQKCFICASVWRQLTKAQRSWLLQGDTDPVQVATWYTLEQGYERLTSDSTRHELKLLIYCHESEESQLVGQGCQFRIEASPEVQNRLDSVTLDIGDHTSSPSSLKLAHQWLETCCQAHYTCNRLTSKQKVLPTRVIDVGNLSSTGWRLHVTSEDVSVNQDYITLSHRWGSATFLQLRAATLEGMKKGMSDSTVPKTFRDAITMTRVLQLKYLWIDSLCILQDNKEDWNRESSRMQSVYTNSICNIAATGAVDGNDGCFFARDPSTIAPCIQISDWDDLPSRHYLITDVFTWEDNVSSAPLLKRAWVVQERILAPRILHFGTHQIFWECNELAACESLPDGLRGPKHNTSKKAIDFPKFLSSLEAQTAPTGQSDQGFNLSIMQLSPYYAWKRMVEYYMQCGLTKTSDKLIAISGIAKMIQASTQDVYIAGLWKRRLRYHLLWHAVVDNAEGALPPVRPPIYRAPSWSWASIDGNIIFEDERDCSNHVMVLEIISTQISLLTDNPTGQVTAGSLGVRGTLYEGIREQDEDEPMYIILKVGGEQFTAYMSFDCEPPILSEKLCCLPVYHDHSCPHGSCYVNGLFLKRQHMGNDCSQRIGYFKTYALDRKTCSVFQYEPMEAQADDVSHCTIKGQQELILI